MKSQTAVIIISHGSPREEANRSFTSFVSKVGERFGDAPVFPAFFSLSNPTIGDQVEKAEELGAERVVLLPYFLHNGQHVRKDIPEQVEQCRSRHPDLDIELLSPLQGEPGLVDAVAGRLEPWITGAREEPRESSAIERASNNYIERHLDGKGFTDAEREIVRRVIHTTADFSFADTMRFHTDAIERGRRALAEKNPVICDVTMVTAGITRTDSETLCAIHDEDVREQASGADTTRAAAAMEKLAPRMEGSIVAIGNAPTALRKLIEMGGSAPEPAVVVGMPVGFVGADQAKSALAKSDLCYITNLGCRGGSGVAASVVNALAQST